jgi:acyl carrier protein
MTLSRSATERIATYIRETLLIDNGEVSLTKDEPLFEGLLDSLAVLRLVAFLESEFGVQVEDGDITPANFNTVDRIGAYLRRKGKGS